MSKSLVWPHEAFTLPFLIMARRFFLPFSKNGWKRLLGVLNLARIYLTNATYTYILGRTPYPLLEEDIIAFVDGNKAKPLADKYTFINILRKIKKGYVTPRQILVHPGERDIKEIVAEVNLWKTTKIFCKPIGGENARGIKVISPNKLTTLLHGFREDYVIEEAMPLVREFRWAISRGKDGTTRRFCYEKIRPFVVGDGKTKLIRLILTNKKMTIRSKVVNLFRKLKELNRVLAKNQKYYLTLTGNPPTGSYEHVITDKKLLAAIDNYMVGLVADLEKYLEVQLPFLCFDVGILDEKLEKKSFVPIECQMPFSAMPYFFHYKNPITGFLYFYYSVL